MTIADDLKSLAYDIRGIPGDFGVRPHTVDLIEREWSGEFSGDGTLTDTVTPIQEARNQPPKVRWLTDEELAVGDISSGSIAVGPITSDHDVIARLSGLAGRDIDPGDASYLRITGPKHPGGGKYRITRVTADRAIHYMIQAAPVDSQ